MPWWWRRRRRSRCSTGLPAAAERTRQRDLGVERARGEVDGEPALRQHRGLGGQHVEVVAEARAVALHGDVVGALGGRLRGALLGLLARDRLDAGDLVGGVAHGIDHGGVVALDRGIEVGRLAAQVGAQLAALEDRQVDRRAHAPLLAARLQELAEAQALEADEGREVDVGIEQGLGIGHVAGGGLDAPARGRDVGSAAQQVGRDVRLQHDRLDARDQRRLEGVARAGLAHERVERVLGDRDLLVERLDLLARLGQAAFALAQFEPGVEAGRDAVAHQLQGFVALCQRALRHRELVIEARPLEVAARHVAREQHAGRVGIGGGGIGGADRGIERGAVLAEEVELPARAELQQADVLDRAAQRFGIDVVGVELLARAIEVEPDLGLERRARDVGIGLRAREAGLRDLQVGVAGHRLVDQAAELRIAEGQPPLAVEGGSGGLVGRGDTERAGIAQLGMGADAGHVGAAGERDHQQRGDHDGSAAQGARGE